jgi:hypothetical protein
VEVFEEEVKKEEGKEEWEEETCVYIGGFWAFERRERKRRIGMKMKINDVWVLMIQLCFIDVRQ